MYNKKHCSPISKNKISCLSNKLLIKIAKILDIDTSLSKKKLYNEINKKISKISKCKNEICWMTIDKIINKFSKKDLNNFKK